MNNLLKCPQCDNLLKIEGSSLQAAGEYRIYVSKKNNKHPEKSYLIIECLKCYFIAKIEIWNGE